MRGRSTNFPFTVVLWPRVRGQRPAQMARGNGSKDAVHRARLPVGKRLQRELQLQARRRVPQQGDLLTLKEAQVLAERWRVNFNTERPHSSLGYRPPAPAAWQVEINTRHGKVENAARFPLFNAPDGGGITNPSAALH